MEENCKMVDTFDPYVEQMIYNNLMNTRKCIGDDKFEYTTQEIIKDDIKYKITASHIPLDKIKLYSKSSCNICFGKGFRIIAIEKEKIPNVEDFMMVSSYDIRNASEEQKKIFIEKEKKNKNWRVALPCKCTIKNMKKKNLQVVCNNMGNIVFEVSCTKENAI